MTKKPTKLDTRLDEHYDCLLGDISNVIDEARRSAASAINCIMTAAYWLTRQHIVEYKQGGKAFYLAYPPNRIYATMSRKSGLGQSDKK